jgi:hypothetical protein
MMRRRETPTRRGAAMAIAMAIAIAGCSSAEERDRSTGGPYDACAIGAEDCPASTEGCAGVVVDYVDYRTAERGLCTSLCATDADCPADPPGLGGACLSFDGDRTFICYERCTRDEDSPPEFGCVDRLPAPGGGESFFEPICLPIR